MHEFNVLALIKGSDRYIFVYDDNSRQQVIDTFRDQAADPNLSLTWFDAVVLTNKAKEQAIKWATRKPWPEPNRAKRRGFEP